MFLFTRCDGVHSQFRELEVWSDGLAGVYILSAIASSTSSVRQFLHLSDYKRSYSTPEGGTPEGRAVSVTRELDLSLLCRIWLFGRHLVSLAKMAEVWPPFFFCDGNTRHCSRVYISRDLIWIKIVVGKTIYKQIVIILAIRFAVLSTVFQGK